MSPKPDRSQVRRYGRTILREMHLVKRLARTSRVSPFVQPQTVVEIVLLALPPGVYPDRPSSSPMWVAWILPLPTGTTVDTQLHAPFFMVGISSIVYDSTVFTCASLSSIRGAIT
jgi:hypothetical protein